MRTITVDAKNAGRRLDRFLSKELPTLPVPLMQKYLRTKRITLGGQLARGDTRVAVGDTLELDVEDEFFAKPERVDPLLRGFVPHLRVLYEDENVLIVDKRPGLVCHPDESEKVDTLLTHVRAYLYQTGAWHPDGHFSPALCNRIDRFTGGIVVAAKNEAALHAVDQKIREREIDKFYLCALAGVMRPPEGRLDNFLYKEEGRRRVEVLERPMPGAQRAVTDYRTLAREGGASLVECALLTGRTHQIRAQFAAEGHPLLGDTQYGDARRNADCGLGYQALCAYRIAFRFRGDAGCVNNLAGKEFVVREVPFVSRLFPTYVRNFL